MIQDSQNALCNVEIAKNNQELRVCYIHNGNKINMSADFIIPPAKTRNFSSIKP